MFCGALTIKFAKRFRYNKNHDRAMLKIDKRKGDFGYG